MIRAVFLDRDGVLNEDVHYLHRISEVQWVSGAKEALAYLTKKGFALIVVTNQSGIARGYYTEEDVQRLHSWMSEEIARSGGKITAFYYCPYLKGAVVKKYDQDSPWRKPAPGMVLQAARDYNVDLSQSFLIGDHDSDMACAEAAGVRGFLFRGGRLDEFIRTIIEGRAVHERL